MSIATQHHAQNGPHAASGHRWCVLPSVKGLWINLMQSRYATLKAQYHHLYECRGEIGDPCTYCGVESSGWDHVPPLHFLDRIGTTDWASHPLRLLPSCAQCNSWLSGAVLMTIAARRAFVKKRLRKKYARVLSLPEWTEADLSQLSEKLADDIRAHVRLASHVRQRLAFYTHASEGSACFRTAH